MDILLFVVENVDSLYNQTYLFDYLKLSILWFNEKIMHAFRGLARECTNNKLRLPFKSFRLLLQLVPGVMIRTWLYLMW